MWVMCQFANVPICQCANVDNVINVDNVVNVVMCKCLTRYRAACISTLAN